MAKFRNHKYTYSQPFGSPRHMWEILGPKGGVHFTASYYSGTPQAGCGLEFHHTRAAQYRCDEAPDHIKCFLTGEPCWHDGTSLYAEERIWPEVQPLLKVGDHEAVFRILECEYDRQFDQYLADRSAP